MDINQLKYFITVAHCQHMTSAAEQLNISQPALSLSISNLEKELNVKLFDRVGRGLVLNEYGTAYLKHAESAVDLLESGYEELSLMQNSSTCLNINYWMSSDMIPRMLILFSEQYPYIKFNAANGIEDYSFRFSFSSYAGPPNEPYDILLQEEICIAVPLSNPLSELDSIESLNDLKDQNFICVSDRLPFRKITDEFCALADFQPKIILENEDYRTLEHLLNLGIGVSFWPMKSWISSQKTTKYKLLHIKYPICMRTLYLSHPLSLEMTPPAEIFRRFALSYFKNIANR